MTQTKRPKVFNPKHLVDNLRDAVFTSTNQLERLDSPMWAKFPERERKRLMKRMQKRIDLANQLIETYV